MIALLFVSFSSLFAQSPPYQRDFVPSTPEASTFNKYGDIGVSKFTGSPSISVPLNISDNVPISINYNASGIKPEEHEGWVGSGFNLSAGGMISRIKRGDIDESKAAPNSTLAASGVSNPYLENYWRLAATNSNGTWDGDDLLTAKTTSATLTTGTELFKKFFSDLQPDEFVFNLNGLSGSFLLNHEGKWVVRGNNPAELKVQNVILQENIFITLSDRAGQIKLPRIIMGFTIVASDGTAYIFGGNEASIDFAMTVSSTVIQDKYTTVYTTGWHLTKIVPTSGQITNFIYVKDEFTIQVNLSRNLGFSSGNYNGQSFYDNQNTTPKPSLTVLRNGYLSEIRNRYDTIKFERSLITSADADDYSCASFPYSGKTTALGGYDINCANHKWFKLNSIKAYGKTLIKHFAFEYGKSASNRLQLKRIKQVDVSNTTDSIPVIEFDYKNTTQLPAYSLGKIDHWGYYTDAGGITMPPVTTGVITDSAYQLFRKPNTSLMSAEILTKMTYPTGGNTIFEFEPHDYAASFDNVAPRSAQGSLLYNTAFVIKQESVNKIAGGLRIKKIVSSDGSSTVEKTYKYVKNYTNVNTPTVSSGILSATPKYFDAGTGTIGNLVINQFSFMTEQSLNPLNLTDGSPVTYSEVVEINKDSSYTVYKFSNYDNLANCNRTAIKTKTKANTTIISLKRDAIIDYGHLRGMLTEEKICNTFNQTVRQTLNSYTTTLDDTKAIRAVSANAFTFSGSVGNASWDEREVRASAYLIHTSPVFLLNSVTKNFYYDPSAQVNLEVSTITENTYDSRKNIIKQEVRHLNNTEMKSNITTNYAYAYDPTNLDSLVPNPNVTEAVANSRQLLLNSFMIGIPLETKNNFNQGSKVDFKKFVVPNVIDNGGIPLNTTTEAMLPYIYYSQNKDSSFTEQFRINSYKDYDKPTQTKEKGMNTPVVTYDWQDGFLISKVFGTSDTQLTWTYNYDFTKRLLTDKTDENGLRMKFTYDGYRRLATTYDRFSGTVASPQNVQTTTTYDYHYQGQASTAASDNDVNRNFIGTTTTILNAINTTPLKTKQYLDGLGRPFMTYRYQYTPTTTDPHQKLYTTYDNQGRVSRVYQPMANATLGVDATIPTGDYKSITYETSPLSRPLMETKEDGKTVAMEYGTNVSTNTEGVWRFNVTYNTNGTKNVAISNYQTENTLFRTTSWDENRVSGDTKRGRTDVFKDKLGRVLLTRKYVIDPLTNAYVNVDTYNVYDDFGDLVMVIPPGAINSSAWTINTALVFEYTYNNERQLTEKKVPNADPVKYYYNNKYQLALVQDGNMRVAKNASGTIVPKYLATVYDEIGRAVKTGFVTSNDPNNITISDAVGDLNRLTRTFYYPNTTWVKDQEAAVLKDAAVPTLRNHIWSSIQRRLTTTAYNGNPGWTGKQHLLSQTYRYDVGTVGDEPIDDNDYDGVDWNVSDYDGAQKPLYSIRYLFAGSSATQVRTRMSFDYDKGQRTTGVKHAFALNGAGVSDPTFTVSNMVYNYKDQLTRKNIANVSGKYLQSVDYAYNARGWLTGIGSVNETGNDYPIFDCTADYPAYGSGTYPSTFVLPSPKLGEDNPDLFTESIVYDGPNYLIPGAQASQYNGNISQIVWQVAGREKQAYSFKYDNLDRMLEANYADVHNSTYAYHGWSAAYKSDNKYKEKVSYDVRGNIKTLERYGLTTHCNTYNGFVGGYFGKIDDLSYNYDPTDNNKLLKVVDGASLALGFKSVSSTANADPNQYAYDKNGNLTADKNKNITNIQYNYLNLPTKITFGLANTEGFEELYFVYDATGQKHQKLSYWYISGGTELDEVIVTNYVNGIEYSTNSNNAVERIAHTEGSIVKNSTGTYVYEYTLKDHLGNTRVTFINTDSNTGILVNSDIKQINNYYPFGLNMEGPGFGAQGANKYQYNGKEWNDDFGLGLIDYGARIYDPAIGRFPSVDPIIEKFPHATPYNYAECSPVANIDLWGLQKFHFTRLQNPDGSNYLRLVGITDIYDRKFTGFQSLGGSGLGSTGAGYPIFETVKNAREEYEVTQEFQLDEFQKLNNQIRGISTSKTKNYNTLEAAVSAKDKDFEQPYSERLVENFLGYAELGMIKVESSVKSDLRLLSLARSTFKGNGQLRAEINSLLEQVVGGNLNPGIGTNWGIFKNVNEFRHANGGRIYFRQVDGVIEILGYSNKNNQQEVINRLKAIYGE